MASPVVNRSPSGNNGLDVVSEHGEHSEAAVLDFLNLKLSEFGVVLGKAERVEGSTRVDRVRSFRLSERSAVDTVGFGGAHKDDLESQNSGDGLSVDEVRVAQVVESAFGEDLSTSLEPDRLCNRNASVLSEEFREEATECAEHSEASMDHFSLAVALEGLRVGGKSDVVPSVVPRELAGEVGRNLSGERAEPLATVRAVEFGVAGVLKN